MTIGTLAILIQIATSFRAPSTYVTSRSQCQNNNPFLWNKCDISVFDRYTPCTLYHEEFRRTRALSLSQQIDQSNAQAPTAGSKKGSVGRSKKSQPNSRTVAINALAQDSASFASRQLEQDENYTMLEARDRSFARLLVATVERRLGQIDKILGLVIAKYPPKKVRPLLFESDAVVCVELCFVISCINKDMCVPLSPFCLGCDSQFYLAG